MQVLRLTIWLLGGWLLPLCVSASGVVVSQVKILDAQSVRFNLQWTHSWYLNTEPANHDAVWVFIKARGATEWQHVSISTVQDHHTTLPNATVTTVPDGNGVFIRRATFGTGNLTTEVMLRLEMPLPAGDMELAVHAVEMVWVPTGAFWLGDRISQKSLGSDTLGEPVLIDKAGTPVQPPAGTGSSTDLLGGSPYRPPADIPPDWPNGYNGFYIMKHELSQAAYCVFLNTLSAQAQQARTAIPIDAPLNSVAMTTSDAARCGIRLIGAGNLAKNQPAVYACNANPDNPPDSPDDGQNRAMNWLSWADLAAWLDWAALRPLTEFEFEKAGRGPGLPVLRELAWGTSEFVDANTIVQGTDGTEFESVEERVVGNQGLGNSGGVLGSGFLRGPLRCGFAATDTSTRQQAGASYYGVLELSGNVWETVVSADSTGLLFEGTPGDGKLSDGGDANTAGWPVSDTAQGACVRGGAWNSLIKNDLAYPFRDLALSDRFYIGLRPDFRRNTQGGRGAR
jgi:formylglycine-generating enzyme required for sulfatase activity